MPTTHGKHEAAAHTHRGRIVTTTGDRIVTKSDVDGECEYVIANDVQVSCDGRPCRLDELELGAIVEITVRKDDESLAIGIDCHGCSGNKSK